jgi:hypothetical protein
VRHARDDALDELEADLLPALRQFDVLTEKKRGTFYRKSQGFFHVHEDPAGLFADVKLDGQQFERVEITTPAQRKRLVKQIRAALTR